MSSTTPLRTSPFRSAREREDERAQKREALLRAAVRMFNERGFHATSLDDVAASVGVTKPVIYHYLGNKDQVLFECVRYGVAKLREAADAARAAPGTGLDRLKRFLERYVEVIISDFGRSVVRTPDEALSAESQAQFRRLKREIDQAMREMVADAVADGSAQVQDVRLAAFTLAGALNGVGRWYREGGEMSLAEVVHGTVSQLCAGLLPRGDTTSVGLGSTRRG